MLSLKAICKHLIYQRVTELYFLMLLYYLYKFDRSPQEALTDWLSRLSIQTLKIEMAAPLSEQFKLDILNTILLTVELERVVKQLHTIQIRAHFIRLFQFAFRNVSIPTQFLAFSQMYQMQWDNKITYFHVSPYTISMKKVLNR